MKTIIIILIFLAALGFHYANDYRTQYYEQSNMRYELITAIEKEVGCTSPSQKEVINCLSSSK